MSRLLRSGNKVEAPKPAPVEKPRTGNQRLPNVPTSESPSRLSKIGKRSRDDSDDNDDRKDEDGKSDPQTRRKKAKKQRIITEKGNPDEKKRIIKIPALQSRSPTIVVKEGMKGMETFAVDALLKILKERNIEVSHEAEWFKDVKLTRQSSSDFNSWTKSDMCSGKVRLPQGATIGECSTFAVPKSFMKEDLKTALEECSAKGPSQSLILLLGFDQEKKNNCAVVGYPWKDTLYYYQGLEAETAYSIVGLLQGTKGEHPWRLRLVD